MCSLAHHSNLIIIVREGELVLICSFLLDQELILFTDCGLCKGNVKHKDPTTDIYHIPGIGGTVFYYTPLHCTSLYLTGNICLPQKSLSVTVFYCIELYFTVLHYASIYFTVLSCTSPYFTVIHCN